MTDRPQYQPARGRWIPWLFVAFFGLVLVANGALIAFAMTSWTGLEAKSAYKQGLDYNRRIEAALRQDELGWQTVLAVGQRDGGKVDLTLDLKDRLGGAITGARIEGELGRPVYESEDRAIRLEEEKPGRYAVDLAGLAPGQWSLALRIDARETAYSLKERIFVQP
jgi:nitrogen fixation protein FixH